ncbi:hypothetical protein G3M48_001854 [Beauveria asiatica]|uniref:Uncharacterized protein n=1 Tax=Beauveria asiatica TaxID=1069075 RepID=A0AAW0RZ09_9HYPO
MHVRASPVFPPPEFQMRAGGRDVWTVTILRGPIKHPFGFVKAIFSLARVNWLILPFGSAARPVRADRNESSFSRVNPKQTMHCAANTIELLVLELQVRLFNFGRRYSYSYPDLRQMVLLCPTSCFGPLAIWAGPARASLFITCPQPYS